MRAFLLAMAAVSVVAAVTVAQGSALSRTTAPPETVAVKVTITDKAFRVRPKIANRGAVARFILVNKGKKAHTFQLGTLNFGKGVQTGFKKALKPNEQAILILFLDYRGTIPYRGSLPADRSKAAMKGIFKVT